MTRLCIATLLAAIVIAPTTLAKERTLLFVDDHDVLYRSGTVRVGVQATKHSDTAVVACTKPWEIMIGWTSIYRDPQSSKYQLWYQAYSGKLQNDKRLECVVCYAESQDGVTFTKPEFDFFPFANVPKTNIVLIGSGGYGDRYCNSVLVEPAEKNPARRYKMAYYDWAEVDGREYPGLHVAFSPNGIHWTKLDKTPLFKTRFGAQRLQPPLDNEDGYFETPTAKGLHKAWNYPLTMADAVDVIFDPRRETYAIYGKTWIDAPDGGGAWKHAMGRIESKDFLNWSRLEFLLAPDDRDGPAREFHTSPVFFHNDRYLCLNQVLNRRLGTIDIELMTSLDGATWDRNFRDAYFLARGKPGTFDGHAIFTNSTPVVLDDEIRFYYGAYDQSPIGGGYKGERQSSGVGFATIPRDRFAGIKPVALSDQRTLKRPLENIGQVTLRPVDLSGCREITLNADAAEGKIFAELLDEDGHRLRGYTKDDAVAIAGDSLSHTIAWKERSLAGLPAGRYMLRLHLDKATVYALSFH